VKQRQQRLLLLFATVGGAIPTVITLTWLLLSRDTAMASYTMALWQMLFLPLLFLWPSRIVMMAAEGSHSLWTHLWVFGVATAINIGWFVALGLLAQALFRIAKRTK